MTDDLRPTSDEVSSAKHALHDESRIEDLSEGMDILDRAEWISWSERKCEG